MQVKASIAIKGEFGFCFYVIPANMQQYNFFFFIFSLLEIKKMDNTKKEK